MNIPELPLEDGTRKIFLNMRSRNGTPETVSLLQYMKDTRLDNPEILVKDERIVRLDRIVTEVKQSEEWEELKVSVYSVAMERGTEAGKKIGTEIGKEIGLKALVQSLKGFLPDAESIWTVVIKNDSYKDVDLGKVKQFY